MRVIAGKYRSRPLRSTLGLDVRPTSDRVREALFNVLTAGNPLALEGTLWIDLYAGTGAVGIEAISRGAKMAYFVEVNAKAISVVAHNLKSLDIVSECEVLKQDALQSIRLLENKKICADFIFLDPPYKLRTEYRGILERLSQSPLLTTHSAVIAEHFKKFDPGDEFDGLRRYRKLQQGDATLSFYRK